TLLLPKIVRPDGDPVMKKCRRVSGVDLTAETGSIITNGKDCLEGPDGVTKLGGDGHPEAWQAFLPNRCVKLLPLPLQRAHYYDRIVKVGQPLSGVPHCRLPLKHEVHLDQVSSGDVGLLPGAQNRVAARGGGLIRWADHVQKGH